MRLMSKGVVWRIRLDRYFNLIAMGLKPIAIKL
ncbi:MAG: hypothetical protein JWQ34_1958 [Mucilaginibacter sp.]|nr:hypothetical protein [Mucilaginibacter sp.]